MTWATPAGGWATPEDAGAGSGGVTRAWQKPSFAVAPTSDTNDIANGNATLVSAGRLSVAVQNPTTVSYTPGTGARWEVALVDVLGAEAADVQLGDIIRTIARASAHYADLVVWAGVLNSANGHGIACGLASNGTVWEATQSRNVGSGWTAPADAIGTPSATTVAVLGTLDVGTGSTGGSYSAIPLDASGAMVAGANLPTARSAAAGIIGPFDVFFLEIGWRTGTGGSAGTVAIGAALYADDQSSAGWDPFA